MNFDERTSLMIEAYGETVTYAKAGRIINRSPTTIKAMLDDGRLDPACEGTRVDVYSIARYICAPKQEDFNAQVRKRQAKTGCRFII